MSIDDVMRLTRCEHGTPKEWLCPKCQALAQLASPADATSTANDARVSRPAPAEELDAVPCYDQHTAGIDEHWHAIPTRSGFSCIVCGERLLEERQFCAKCEPSWRHPAAPAEGLREAALARALESHNAYHPDPKDAYGYDPCDVECAAAIAREYGRE